MRRLIIICQVMIVVFFIVKVTFLTESMHKTAIISSLHLDNMGQAIAQTPVKGSVNTIKDVTDDGLQHERELSSLLQKRQKELDVRESSIRAEEQKMLALKKEIMDKIDVLTALEARLSSKLEAEKVKDSKRFRDLAKVYEAIPPQKAAAMIEKLDLKTAAGITIQMKRDRAGAIWGHLSPQKATEITKEITSSVPTGNE